MAATGNPVFSEYKHRRASDFIASEIKKSILAKKFQEGDRLPSERSLADQFSVSRLSIRDALRLLETQGLIVIKQGATGGAFVQAASQEKIATTITDMMQFNEINPEHMMETRIIIECGLVKYAVENARGEDLDRIEESVESSKNIVDPVSIHEARGITARILEFHELLAKAAHITPLTIIHRVTIEWGERRLRNWMPTREEQWSSYTLHRQILEAIKERNTTLGQALMEKHIRDWISQIESRLKEESS